MTIQDEFDEILESFVNKKEGYDRVHYIKLCASAKMLLERIEAGHPIIEDNIIGDRFSLVDGGYGFHDLAIKFEGEYRSIMLEHNVSGGGYEDRIPWFIFLDDALRKRQEISALDINWLAVSEALLLVIRKTLQSRGS